MTQLERVIRGAGNATPSGGCRNTIKLQGGPKAHTTAQQPKACWAPG